MFKYARYLAMLTLFLVGGISTIVYNDGFKLFANEAAARQISPDQWRHAVLILVSVISVALVTFTIMFKCILKASLKMSILGGAFFAYIFPPLLVFGIGQGRGASVPAWLIIGTVVTLISTVGLALYQTFKDKNNAQIGAL